MKTHELTNHPIHKAWMRMKRISKAQKDILDKMSDGFVLFENLVTPNAKWSLVKDFKYINWGNVHGNVVNEILELMEETKINFAVKKYHLKSKENIEP